MKKSIIAIVVMLLLLAVTGRFFVLKKKVLTNSVAVSCCHESYFSQKDFYEESYGNAKSMHGDARTPIQAIMVNHHLLAASYIAEAFNQVATTAPLTVLLVSPNHFNAGKGNIITSAEQWQTPYGKLEPDEQFVHELTAKALVTIEEDPFSQEHGISGIVAFIKKSLPNARVVPVIFRNRMTLGQSLKAADQFKTILPNNTLVVGSFDFSHYLPSNAADFHDLENLNAVESFDLSSIYNLDIDSRPGLSFFLRLLKDSNAQKFTLLEHSNSAKFAKIDALETTSYITGYFTDGQPATSSVDTLLSLGPIAATSTVERLVEKKSFSYALTYMERLLYGQDATFAFINASDPFVESAVKKLGVLLEHENHIVRQLGPLRVDLALCSSGQAEMYINSGSDIVVCQGASINRIEMYKNKPIIYAQGNFLDSKAINSGKGSMAVGLAHKNNLLRIYLLPIGVQQGEIKLLVGKENDTVLREMAANSMVSTEIKTEIKTGVADLMFANGRKW
jgi:AmmeMemoRadiSam system protein B